MVRWRIDLEYDGLGFAGWQLQPDARTVQGELERAVESVFLAPSRIHGAGRTDAGVSARQQVAIFDHDVPRPAKAVLHGLNHHLPDDVAVLRAVEVGEDFHPRHSPHRKTYCYTWLVRPARPVLSRGRCWHSRHPLDVPAMHDAVQCLVGLRHQGRIVAGTLAEIGSGRRGREHLEQVLRARSRDAAGRTAPAEGLMLESIDYDGE